MQSFVLHLWSVTHVVHPGICRYAQQDDAYAEGKGDYAALKSAVDEAVETGADTKDPLVQMANALLDDMKEEYDQMMAKKAKDEAARIEKNKKVF